MGYVTYHDISHLMRAYNLQHFIETGTGGGDGIESIKHCGFKTISSIEITPLLYKNAVERFKENKIIDIHLGDSREILPIILNDIEVNEPVLFWLDGHYPGADYGLGEYKAEDIPLERELRIIKSIRPTAKDVFLIDDLRIYLQRNYQAGNLNGFKGINPVGNIDFVYELFSNTHDIQLSDANEGYIMLYPLG